jgi:hypothetical protein
VASTRQERTLELLRKHDLPRALDKQSFVGRWL